MKQTSGALSLLLSAYRSVFSAAYTKGIAAAVVLTAGLSAGAANAADIANNAGDLSSSSADTALTISENSKAESITITANGTLTGDAANDKLYVADAITVSDSGAISISSGAVVRGYNGTTGEGLPSDGDTTGYTAALTMNGANTTLTLASGGALQMNSVALTGTTVSIAGAKSDSTSWNTEYAQLTGNSITLDNAKVTLGAKSLVQTKGVLNVNGADTVIAMEGSGTESGGKASAAGGAIINGTADSHLNFNDGTINVATGKYGEIHSPDINLNGTDINVSGALTLSGQLRKTAEFGNLTADVDMNAGTITVAKGGTLTVNGTFDVQDDGSLINSGTVTLKENADLSDIHTLRNEGTIKFNGDSLTLASHLFDALFATTGEDSTGSLSLAKDAVVRVVGDEQIDLSVASSTGAHNITAAGSNTLYVENAKLDNSWDNANLALNVGTLDVSADLEFTEQSPENNAFVITSGSITVSDAININVKDNATDTDGEGRIYVYAKDAGTNVNLDLVNDGAVTGQLNNLDRLFVGVGTSTSGTAALNVSGNWNFGDARIVAGQSGSVSLGGTVTNVDSLMLNGNGSVTVREGANVIVQRLLGSESSATGTITVNGTLAFTGDGLDDKEASSREGEYVNDVNLTKAKVSVDAGGTLAFTTEDAWDDFLKKTVADGVTSYEVLSTGGKTTDFGGWDKSKVTVNGTLALELGDVNLGEKKNVEKLKTDLIGSGTGVLNIGSATYKLEQSEKGDGSYDYEDIAEGVSNSQTENAVVNVGSGDASSGVTGEFGSVSLADDAGSDINVKQDSTLILNQASAGNFVNTADSEAANVTVKSSASVVLNGSGNVGNIVKDNSATGTSAVLNANGGSQTAGKVEVATLTVQQGTVSVQSVTAENLTLTRAGLDVVGTGDEGTNNITATSGSTVTSSSIDAGTVTLGNASGATKHDIAGSDITADTLTLLGASDQENTLNVNGGSVIDVTTFNGVSGAQINVGSDDAEGSTGTIVADTLNLSGATLTIDPVYGADFAAGIFEKIGDDNTLDGNVQIGQNSVMAVGDFESRADLASLLAGNGLLSGGSLREETGALLVLDDRLTIASGYGIALDGTKVTGSTANTVTLNEGSAIVLTDGAFGGRDDATGEVSDS